MQIRHFRRFRQNDPFLAGTQTRSTKNTVCAGPNLVLEEDKRATTNVQNGLAVFFLFSKKKP